MNGAFKSVSGGWCFYVNRCGTEPVHIEREMTKMLALLVLGAVVLAFIIEAAVVAFGTDEF